MKQHFSKIIALAALASTPFATAHLFVPRSQSVNAARELAGWEHEVNKSDMEDIYGTFALTFEGVSSMRSSAIAQGLLGSDVCCDKCPTLRIQGSQVANRNANAWLADYFGLAPDFQSVVTFEPSISSFIADFNAYVGLDNLLGGLYFRIHAPIQRTVWRLNMEESEVTGHGFYPQGYMSPTTGIPAPLVFASSPAFQTFTQAVTGAPVTTVGAPANYLHAFSRTGGTAGYDPTAESMYRPLAVCLFGSNDCDCPSNRRVGLADLRMMLGWNFLRSEDYHLGLGLIVAAPTGNTPDPEYLFSPVIGNGHHTEVGGQLTSHYTFWRSEDDARSFGLYLDLNVTHLFGDCQRRCMDLCGKPNSKFMLAEKLAPDLATTTTSGYTFAFEYAQVANLTTRSYDVSIPWQVDLALLANYTSGAFSMGIGYEFFGQACEKFGCDSDCSFSLTGQYWALKGDAFVYDLAPTIPVPMAATESKATIYNGTNGTTKSNVNAKIDNPVLQNATQFTSKPPIFIKETDLDLDGAQTKQRSNKLFAHFTYRWDEWKYSENWLPYVGVGTEIEWGSGRDCCDTDCGTSCVTTSTTTSSTNCCTTSCNDCDCCTNFALSQWGVWFKGGLSFS